MESGGKGSFQVVKLQSPPGLPCAVTPQGHGLPRFSKSSTIMTTFRMNGCPIVNILRMASLCIVKLRKITMNFRSVRWSVALISMGAFAVAPGIGLSDLSAAVLQDSQQPGNPTPNNPNGPTPPGRGNPDKPNAPKKPYNPNDRKAPPKSPPSGPNNPNPPSGPNNPNPPSGPAPSAPSGPGSSGGTSGGTR